MKEFSRNEVSVTDRRFEIGGTILEWRYPYFEELVEVLGANRKLVEAGAGLDEKETIELLIEWSALFLTEDSAGKWREIAHRRENPIPPFQYGRLFEWLIEEASGNRPTESPSGSEPGGGNTEQSSPDGSPSTAATPTS